MKTRSLVVAAIAAIVVVGCDACHLLTHEEVSALAERKVTMADQTEAGDTFSYFSELLPSLVLKDDTLFAVKLSLVPRADAKFAGLAAKLLAKAS